MKSLITLRYRKLCKLFNQELKVNEKNSIPLPFKDLKNPSPRYEVTKCSVCSESNFVFSHERRYSRTFIQPTSFQTVSSLYAYSESRNSFDSVRSRFNYFIFTEKKKKKKKDYVKLKRLNTWKLTKKKNSIRQNFDRIRSSLHSSLGRKI